MAIRLKSLRLPSTEILWYKAVNKNKSTSSYATEPITISEAYYQDSTGVLGGVRLGTEHNLWIPAKFSDGFSRGEKLKIGGKEYEINDIQEMFYRDIDGTILKPNSAFESHYQLVILNPND
jgi:hypothetical protein